MQPQQFVDLLGRVTATGLHENPIGNPDYFTTSYFHLPDDLSSEMTEAGLERVEVETVRDFVAGRTDADALLVSAESGAVVTMAFPEFSVVVPEDIDELGHAGNFHYIKWMQRAAISPLR